MVFALEFGDKEMGVPLFEGADFLAGFAEQTPEEDFEETEGALEWLESEGIGKGLDPLESTRSLTRRYPRARARRRRIGDWQSRNLKSLSAHEGQISDYFESKSFPRSPIIVTRKHEVYS